jgi:hypothetical protein
MSMSVSVAVALPQAVVGRRWLEPEVPSPTVAEQAHKIPVGMLDRL